MKRLVAALLVAAASLVAVAPAATAADSIVIRKLDFSKFPAVTISAQVSGPTPPLDSFTLRENGRIVTKVEVVPIGKTDTPVGIVLVVDISGSMRGAKLEAAKAAAKQFVEQKLANDQIAVVAFNQAAQVVSGFTADRALLDHAIDGLTAAGETALFDGVRMSATLLADRPDLQANIVVLSDGADTASQNNAQEAEAAVVGAKASLFAVGLRAGDGRGDFDAGSLTRLSQASGGRYAETPDAASLKGLYATVQRDIQNQYEVTYLSTATGSVEVSLAASGLRTNAGPVNAGSVSQGSSTKPEVLATSRFAKPLSGPGSLAAIAVVAFLAAALIVVSAAALTRRGVPALSARLRPYGPEGGGAFEGRPGQPESDLVQTVLVRRAVDATARLARSGDLLASLEKKLGQADLPVRPAEALFFYTVGVVVAVVLGGLLGGLFAAALALIVFGLTPVAVLNILGRRRRAKFTSQLPDVLRLLASSLRAGFSLLQAADAASEQVEDPMSKELRRVLVEARLGRPLETALADSAKRVQSPDFDWVVIAIGIQREVGGNLAELLSTVADTMISRERLRQEVKTLTAEGRISAIVLAALPVAIGITIYILNPGYLDPLLHRTSGQLALLASIVAAIGGFLWMRKIVDIPRLTMLIVAVASVFGALVLLALAATSQMEQRAAVRSSLRQIGDYEIDSARADELRRSIVARLGVPVAEGVVGLGRRFTPAGYITQVTEKLTQAGKARSDDVDRFLAIRVVTIALVPVALALCFLVLQVNGRLQWAIAVFGALVLLLGPDAELNRQVADRRYAIQVQLPDVLDLLTISVEAGLGFEQALDRTVSSVPGALSDEFGRMLGEVRAGSSRADALRAFEQRIGVPEVKSFVLALVQADAFGISIGRVLRLQADEMRVRRRQLAQERAQKAPVKMLFPMVFCIFPALFIVVLGPAMITSLEGLRNA